MPTGGNSRRNFLGLCSTALISSALPAWSRETDVMSTGETSAALQPLDDMLSRFLADQQVPGVAVAVTSGAQLVYSRGFGWADRVALRPVQPDSLFRIASLSKPLTAVAVLQLVEQQRVGLDDRLLDVVPLEPFCTAGASVDPRVRQITIRQLLQHTGGWDRDVSYDPIGRPRDIATQMGVALPPSASSVTRYALGLPLDFDPGARYAYSNVGYLCLGRVIEHVTGLGYVEAVRRQVLQPLNITRMQLGRALEAQLAPDEVRYFDRNERRGKCLYAPMQDQEVPVVYGAENLEGYEAHGGWIASASDLARFASAFGTGFPVPLLGKPTIETMWSRPEGAAGHEADGTPRDAYYGCGWMVRPVGDRGVNAWHSGRIAGTSTLLVRRWDGLSWAVLFNSDTAPSPGKAALSTLIDPLMHQAVDACRANGAFLS